MKTESATLMFGMVNIPVKITGAVKTATTTTPFKRLHSKCLTPVSNQVRCEKCNKPLGPDDIVKGVKVGGKYVEVPAEKLDETKAERSRIVTITKFVPYDEIFTNSLQFYKHYHLIPDDNITDGYALLNRALIAKKKIGIGSSCLWGKEHPVAVQPHGTGLLLSLLHPHNDMVVMPYEPPAVPGKTPKETKSMVDLAIDLIERQAGTLEPDDTISESRQKREALVDEILNTVEAPTPTMDLLAALRLSIGGKKKVKA